MPTGHYQRRKGQYGPMPEERKRKIAESLRGKKHSEERRRKSAESRRGMKMPPRTEEHRRNISIAQRKRWDRGPRETKPTRQVRGFYLAKDTGYRYLTGQYDHPLAGQNGIVAEHRKVLYDKIGPGTHECHWHGTRQCGRTALTWGGRGKNAIRADHLDDDILNNSPDNLVPSCCGCNTWRSRDRAEALRQLARARQKRWRGSDVWL